MMAPQKIVAAAQNSSHRRICPAPAQGRASGMGPPTSKKAWVGGNIKAETAPYRYACLSSNIPA